MRCVLFIDCAPFVGGAQESFTTLVEGFPNCPLAVGDGLASRFPNATRIHARHWRANLAGLIQFLSDRRNASQSLRSVLCDGGNVVPPPTVLCDGGNAVGTAPALIHANTLRSALLLTSLHLSCPVIVHDRDIRAPRPALRYIARKLRPTIIAISSTVAQKWRGVIPDENIHIIYNGFRLDEIRTTKQAQFPWSGPTIVLAADFIPWKRHRLFVDAFSLARKRIPELHAVLRGRLRSIADEAYLKEIRDYASNIPNISIDTASGSALSQIAASDMLVSCSDNEPFGRTIIEAIALSKNVVATPTAAPPELFTMLAPNLVKAEDSSQSLADAIVDNLYKAFSPVSLDAFSVDTMLDRINAVHVQCCRRIR